MIMYGYKSEYEVIQSDAADFYVSPDGNDDAPGTLEQPFATLDRAKEAVRALKQREKKPVHVLVRGGTYHLEKPLIFNHIDSGSRESPVVYSAYPGEFPVLSGGKKISGQWESYRDGIMMCKIPWVKEEGLYFTQLFVNGKRQIRARYPNFDSADPIYGGYTYAQGPISEGQDDVSLSQNFLPGYGTPGFLYNPENFTNVRWKTPQEGIVHIFPYTYYGNLQFEIKDMDWDRNIIWLGKGGFQVKDSDNRIDHRSRFFIENIFEELDAPGEWYLDKEEGVLYYYPAEEIDIFNADIVAPLLEQLIEFRGSYEEPVRYITLSGFRMVHTTSTFLKPYEILPSGDWTIHRGGAVFFNGAENCRVERCFFDAVGGNGVFINNYNKGIQVYGNKFAEAGESAVCLVGSRHLTIGSNPSYSMENIIMNNLIHDCGIFGKQTAGVFVSTSIRNRISHNEIYNMPRAGICINDGFVGGHIVEYNRVYNTVRETSDHGPFNSWGREMFWCLNQSHGHWSVSHVAGDVKACAQETTYIRNNYFRDERGWGIDLDDGSSNYHVYNNLCIGISIKLREGDYRIIENNIFVHPANPPGFHVGYENNHDRFIRNIIVTSTEFDRPELDANFTKDKARGDIYQCIFPPLKGRILEEIDYNVFFNDIGEFYASVTPRGSKPAQRYSLDQWKALGYDVNSIYADPLFMDPDNDDYRVRPESPAIKMGFINFDPDEAGLLPDFPKQWWK
jgi:hypothetical protein